MPINKSDDPHIGKCPFCLESPPCQCVFNDQAGNLVGSSDITLDLSAPQVKMLDVLIDIKSELAEIKNLLQAKSLKDDLEAILKVHHG
jgi:hypothetical protein